MRNQNAKPTVGFHNTCNGFKFSGMTLPHAHELQSRDEELNLTRQTISRKMGNERRHRRRYDSKGTLIVMFKFLSCKAYSAHNRILYK